MPFTSSTPSTPEVAYRGIRHAFEFAFFADDDQTDPVIPFDTASYPRIQIIDPDGQVLLTRTPPTVRPGSTPGFWIFDFDVPVDAEVTAVNHNWEFAAEIIDANGRHDVYRTTFVVKDPTVIKSGNVSRYYPVVRGNSVRVMYRSPVELYRIRANVLISGSEDQFLVQDLQVGSNSTDIRHGVSGGIHVYYVDLPPGRTTGFTERDLTTGVWQVHWLVQESAAEPEDLVYQIIEVYDNKILEYTRHVRFIVDKLEKRMSTRQGYDEADILAALTQGLNLVNTVMPSTGYTLTSVPPTLQPYVIMAAGFWCYLGQLGLAVDLSFNFSGQQVVLDQDQTGGIESILERFRSMIWEALKEVKTDILRHERRVGIVATRPTRYRYLRNTVFRIDQGVGASIYSYMNAIGLL